VVENLTIQAQKIMLLDRELLTLQDIIQRVKNATYNPNYNVQTANSIASAVLGPLMTPSTIL
jgi:hypothetical protein